METPQKIPVVLDGDPGFDDAAAWMLARSDRRLDIRALTVCAGNDTAAACARRALELRALLDIDAPVAMGPGAPADDPDAPEGLSPLAAPELIARVLRDSAAPVVLIVTGPQTNAAALLRAHPEAREKLACISAMGGGFSGGNRTPAAEFNFYTDPEAARDVLASGAPIVLCPLDATRRARMGPEDIARIRAVGNPVARRTAQWLEAVRAFHPNDPAVPLHDPCAVAVLLRPELFTLRELHVEVSTDPAPTRGATAADPADGRAPNALCALDADRAGLAALLEQAVRSYGTPGPAR